jgi:hypothetical protein
LGTIVKNQVEELSVDLCLGLLSIGLPVYFCASTMLFFLFVFNCGSVE